MTVTRTDHGGTVTRRRWKIAVVAGPSRGATCELVAGKITIGSAADSTLTVDDPKVSRRHLEIELGPAGLVVRDLGSKNGTFLDQVRIHAASLPAGGAELVLGDSRIAITAEDEGTAGAADAARAAGGAVAGQGASAPVSPSGAERCGRMVGTSRAMRQVFAWIEHLAPLPTTVLLQGETGTGKELAAEAIHAASGRAGPYVIVDCGSIPRGLIESELFGHVRGAFTGAIADRPGAFERAHGGTILLDEIGELELDLQPRLLRVLETGRVRRVGGDDVIDADVRIIAASLRDLSAEVAAGRFRADLYYRLAVAPIRIPPLRERPDDIPALVAHFCAALGIPTLPREAIAQLAARAWPGNVRELRNAVERTRALPGALPGADAAPPPPEPAGAELLRLPYKEAKGAVIAEFTREYLVALLRRHGGNASAAAREAKIERDWLVALARRYDIPLRDTESTR